MNPNLLVINGKKQHFLPIKTVILSILQFVLTILMIVFMVKTIQSFNKMGWIVDKMDYVVPTFYEENRIFFLLFITLFLLISISLIFIFIKHKNSFWDKSVYFSLFSYFLIFMLIRDIIRNKDVSCFFEYMKLDDNLNKTISHKRIITSIAQLNFRNKLFWNTLLYYFTLSLFLVGFFLIILKSNKNFADPQYLPIIDKFSYFTNITNILCFFYLFLMLFFYNRTSFKNNTYLINLSAYIIIVSLIYWCFLFPVNVSVDAGNDKMKLLRGVWLHAVDPIFFIAFAIFSFATNNNMNPSLKSNLGYGVIYPIWYGSYAYTIPFMARVTIYGFITNPNPYMILFGEKKSNGNPLVVLSILAFAILFILFIFIFNKINKKIVYRLLIK